VVLHTAAWTNVDGCETDPDRAYLVNAMGTRNVAEAARLVGARVVGVSTDYVFDGRGTGPSGGGAYNEWDATGPISHYGRSKLGGEHELIDLLGPDATVVRTSWVCGEHGSNFVKTMLRLAVEGAGEQRPVTVVDDQHGTPTFTPDLAATIRLLALHRMPGRFHVSNAGPTTWFEVARAVFAAAGQPPERVRPVTTAQLLPARPAPRPAWSVLDNAGLRAVGLPALGDWHEPLERLVATLRS
jgi:dTDP-4-dehydrorhamnose reductase